MSLSKNGAGRPHARRMITLAGVLVITFGLAILSSGAGAAGKCEVLSTTSYVDPTGDGNGAGAPDITTIVASSWEDGTTSLEVAFVERPEFGTDMAVQAYLDTDKNAATGNAKGFEYVLEALPRERPGVSGYSLKPHECDDQPAITLSRWDGEAWVAIPDVKGLSTWYGDSKLTLKWSAAAIGNAIGFNFAVYAATSVSFDGAGQPVFTTAASDWAPDEGTYVYQPFDYSSYADALGDGGGAPDLGKIVVTRWRGGLFKFWIEIPAAKAFTQDMLLETWIDADSNSETGNPNGYEYLVRAQPVPHEETPSAAGKLAPGSYAQPVVTLLAWDGAGWASHGSESLDWLYDSGLKLSIDPGELGNPVAFTFIVTASAPVSFDESGNPIPGETPIDRAPDSGSYSFPLQIATAQLLGTYKVQYKVIKAKNFADLKRGAAFSKTWKFVQSCKKKNCVTRVVVSGGEHFKLAKKGRAAYKAKTGRKFACEAGLSAKGTQKVQLRAKKGAWVKGKWRVAKWTGSVSVVSPANGVAQCGGAASYSASLTGKRK